MIEQVLTIPRATLDATVKFQGFKKDTEAFLKAAFAPGTAKFLPRPAAEEDPSHKQLIPYCILTHAGKILIYRRGKSGGEKRLTDKFSLGIGGHINPIDSAKPEIDEAAYEAAVQRELDEEISHPKIVDRRIAGLINDDSNPVGSVHLGVIEVFDLVSEKVTPKEAAIADPEFLTIEELLERRDQLENWSQIVLDHIAEILPQESYHFDCGNSNTGAIGFCASVKARTRTEAISFLKEGIPEEIKGTVESPIEYLRIYLNPEAVTSKDVDNIDIP